MSAASTKISIRPDRCDRCGKCVVACPRSLVKVGGGYIYLDAAKCQSCFACVNACSRGAIERGMPSRPVASHAGAKVVVGSRAEAKAYKKAAQAAEKSSAVVKRPLKPTAAAATAGGTGASVSTGTGAGAGAVGRMGGALAARLAASLGWNAGAKPAASATAGDRPGIPWSPQEVVAILAVALAAFALKQVALSSFAFEVMPPSGKVIARSIVLAAFYGIQIAVIALLARRRGFGIRAAFALGADRDVGRTFANAGLVALLLVGTRAFSVSWAAMMRGLGWAPPSIEGADFSALFGAGVAGLIVTLLAVAVIGPFAEELVFRGALLRMFAERIGEWPAVFVTALLYAGSHLEPWVFVSTFVLGLALGWLAWMRRSLGSAIVLHALYNAVAVLAAYYVAS